MTLLKQSELNQVRGGEGSPTPTPTPTPTPPPKPPAKEGGLTVGAGTVTEVLE